MSGIHHDELYLFYRGVGGIEASLFASELVQMYYNYAQFMKWKWTPYQMDALPSGKLRFQKFKNEVKKKTFLISSLILLCFAGGIRSAVVFVRGMGAFRTLRYEAGVHRVQRFPVTDKTRMHTSTSVVAVLPEPEKVHFLSAIRRISF